MGGGGDGNSERTGTGPELCIIYMIRNEFGIFTLNSKGKFRNFFENELSSTTVDGMGSKWLIKK